MNFCVVGSLNMDLVVKVDHFPQPGETIVGSCFNTFYGGKGGNQAFALSKLSADVSFIGKVGNDVFGAQYLEHFEKNKINREGISSTQTSTGTAHIEVEISSAQNHIIVVPGANNDLTPVWVEENRKIIEASDVLMLQLEIPMESVVHAAKIMKEKGGIVILDPAPAIQLPEQLLDCVDYITPNETEATILTSYTCNTEFEIKKAAQKLMAMGVPNVLIKAGKKGAYLINSDTFIYEAGFSVEAVDSTAAGDAFNAGLAYAIGKAFSAKDIIRHACAVGALTTTGFGAQEAMPDYESVVKMLKSQESN